MTSQFGVGFKGYTAHDRGELALRVTRDGGRTWQRRFGVLTEDRGALYVSRDGRLHFHAVPVARPEVDFAGGAAAFRGGIAYVLLTSADPRLAETRDFGRTWHVVRRWR